MLIGDHSVFFMLYRVAQAYVNQKKLDTETKILQANVAQFSKQTTQWLKLVEDFNQAVKVRYKLTVLQNHRNVHWKTC